MWPRLDCHPAWYLEAVWTSSKLTRQLTSSKAPWATTTTYVPILQTPSTPKSPQPRTSAPHLRHSRLPLSDSQLWWLATFITTMANNHQSNLPLPWSSHLTWPVKIQTRPVLKCHHKTCQGGRVSSLTTLTSVIQVWRISWSFRIRRWLSVMGRTTGGRLVLKAK